MSTEQHGSEPESKDHTEAASVTLGYISGVFGVKGWVKVFSDTVPRENILQYGHWNLTGNPAASARARAKKPVAIGADTKRMEVLEGRLQGKVIVARLKGVDSREDAALLTGASILVYRTDLPALRKDEYYWSDLIGMTVINTDNVPFGTVTRLFETGANDVMVVNGERERLIPWIQALHSVAGQRDSDEPSNATVMSVDTDAKTITVDWGENWDLDD